MDQIKIPSFSSTIPQFLNGKAKRLQSNTQTEDLILAIYLFHRRSKWQEEMDITELHVQTTEISLLFLKEAPMDKVEQKSW
jgi:hypothetical protein